MGNDELRKSDLYFNLGMEFELSNIDDARKIIILNVLQLGNDCLKNHLSSTHFCATDTIPFRPDSQWRLVAKAEGLL